MSIVTVRVAVVALVAIGSTVAAAEGKPDAGEATVGEAKAGEAKAGEAKAGEAKAGEAKAGEAKAGGAKAGGAKAGGAKAGGAKAQARAAYLLAREHYEAGRYAEAVVELKRAYSLVPFRVLLRYIADSYYGMKKYPLALKYYRLYLRRARSAQDKVEVGLRVRELEESLSVDEEGPPTVSRKRAKLPPDLLPTGRDAELPSDLMPASLPAAQPEEPNPPSANDRDRGSRGRLLRYAKWSALGVSVAALAVGLTFHLLASSKARELEDNVRSACPEGEPACEGNPTLARPVSIYTREQYDLEQTYLRYQNRATGFYIGAGAAAAAAVVLFVLDRPRRRPVGPRAGVVPAIGAGRIGLAGEVQF